jgi:hypothetical protein
LATIAGRQVGEKIPIDRKVNYDFSNVCSLDKAVLARSAAAKSKLHKDLGVLRMETPKIETETRPEVENRKSAKRLEKSTNWLRQSDSARHRSHAFPETCQPELPAAATV